MTGTRDPASAIVGGRTSRAGSCFCVEWRERSGVGVCFACWGWQSHPGRGGHFGVGARMGGAPRGSLKGIVLRRRDLEQSGLAA